ATFSSIGLPGLNNFIGEFMILLGLFHSKLNPHAVVFAAMAVSAVVLGAAYLLWLYRRIFFGPLKEGLATAFYDLKPAETAILIPLIILMFVMGLTPAPVLKFFEPSTIALMR